jgi:addiction module RelE/StbE family toxin
MRRVAWDSSFRRAFKRTTRKDPHLRRRILDVIEMLTEDASDPRLRTHKLRGKLEGLWACWVEYDCRIVFAFEPDPRAGEDMIVLIDIGTHDEVY